MSERRRWIFQALSADTAVSLLLNDLQRGQCIRLIHSKEMLFTNCKPRVLSVIL